MHTPQHDRDRRARVALLIALVITSLGAASGARAAAQLSGGSVAVNWSHTATPTGSVAPSATIETLSVSTLNVPEVHAFRTISRLTVSPRAQWQTVMADESLTLSLETGSLHIELHDGSARIARGIDSIHRIGGSNLVEFASGEELTMWPGDRLVFHGYGTLMVYGAGNETADATLVRVTTQP